MNHRNFLTLLYLLVTVTVSIQARENVIRTFGPVSGPRLVFTTPDQEDRRSVLMLERLAERLEQRPPSIRVSVIITESDFSLLPEDIRTGYPEGTNGVISLLSEDESGAVVLVCPGPDETVSVINGVRMETTPPWLLRAVADRLDAGRSPWALAEPRTPIWRLGWKAEDPLLAAYLDAGIPAIMLRSGADLTDTLENLAGAFPEGFPGSWDRHYLAVRLHGKLRIAGEGLLVLLMICASATILFFVFIFSFLLGEKGEQHRRDFLHVWWLPFTYLLINILCLYGGQAVVAFLLRFRFGETGSLALMPAVAIATKLTVAWFFINLLESLNQLIRMPEDSFIYGYIASLMCLVNIFVFSSLDFSLTPLFLGAYVISFAVYHFKHPLAQVAGIVILLLPFIPYLAALRSGGDAALAPLVYGTEFWNLRLSLFAMPAQFLLSRLFHTAGLFGLRSRFYLPVNLILSFAVAAASIGLLLFMPVWSVSRPLPVEIRQTISDSGSTVEVRSPVSLSNLVPVPDPLKARPAGLPGLTAANFLRVEASSRRFLERQIVTVEITPLVPVQKIEMTVIADRGLAVYDSPVPFEVSAAGQTGRFSSGESPDIPFRIQFSSAHDSRLSAVVKVWSRTNPEGLSFLQRDIAGDYLLEVVTSRRLPGSGTETVE